MFFTIFVSIYWDKLLQYQNFHSFTAVPSITLIWLHHAILQWYMCFIQVANHCSFSLLLVIPLPSNQDLKSPIPNSKRLRRYCINFREDMTHDCEPQWHTDQAGQWRYHGTIPNRDIRFISSTKLSAYSMRA